MRRGRPRRECQQPGSGLRLPGRDPLLRRRALRPGRRAHVVKNAICMHEEDYGVLWKHTDFRTGQGRGPPLAAAGHLVLLDRWRTTTTDSSGTSTRTAPSSARSSSPASCPWALTRRARPQPRRQCAPGLYAPHHQHFFNVRLDFAVDGQRNTVVEVDVVPDPLGPDNPYGNAWRTAATPLTTRIRGAAGHRPRDGALLEDLSTESKVNHVGDPVGYKFLPGDNTLPMLHERPGAQARRFRRPSRLGHALPPRASGTGPATTRTRAGAATACR